MEKRYVVISILVFLAFLVLSVVNGCTGLYNQEVSLRKQIEAKQVDNKSEFDNMWKKIKQTSNVADKYKDGLREVLVAYTEGRTSDSDKLVFKWANEAIPNFSPEIYIQIDNVITASRDRFTEQQKILLDLKREHDTLVSRFPNVIFFRIMGIGEIEVKTVTSTRTEKSFETGKDDDVEL